MNPLMRVFALARPWPALITAVRLASIVLVPAACKPDHEIPEGDAPAWLSDAYCEQAFACGCVDTAGFSSYEACRVTTQRALTDEQSAAVEADLLYDESCLMASIDRV